MQNSLLGLLRGIMQSAVEWTSLSYEKTRAKSAKFQTHLIMTFLKKIGEFFTQLYTL